MCMTASAMYNPQQSNGFIGSAGYAGGKGQHSGRLYTRSFLVVSVDYSHLLMALAESALTGPSSLISSLMITNESLLPPIEYPEPFWEDEWTSERPRWLHRFLQHQMPWLHGSEHPSSSGVIAKGELIKSRAREEGDLFCSIHKAVSKAEGTFPCFFLGKDLHLTAKRPGPSWRSHIPPLGGIQVTKCPIHKPQVLFE